MNRIKELCVRKGIEQKELAIIVGVSQPTVSDWFNNKKNPKGKNLAKLSEILDVPRAVIMGYEDVSVTSSLASTDKAPTPQAAKMAETSPESSPLYADLEGLSDSSDNGAKKEPIAQDELNAQNIQMLTQLSPQEVQRVLDFVAGLKAARTVTDSQNPSEN